MKNRNWYIERFDFNERVKQFGLGDAFYIKGNDKLLKFIEETIAKAGTDYLWRITYVIDSDKERREAERRQRARMLTELTQVINNLDEETEKNVKKYAKCIGKPCLRIGENGRFYCALNRDPEKCSGDLKEIYKELKK